ncbi:MAG: hypothetical protein ABFD54_08125 [Armatimonadota bacterium]|nr:hypothetical protein [bacterium]
MTDRDVLSLAGRVLGIMWLAVFVSSMRSSASLHEYLLNTLDHANVSQSVLNAVYAFPLLDMLIALAMLMFSSKIARLLVPHPANLGDSWQRWAFSTSAKVIGLVLLLQGLDQMWDYVINHYIATHIVMYAEPNVPIDWSRDITSNIFAITATLAISVYLVSGAKHLYLNYPFSVFSTFFSQLLPKENQNEQP